MAIYTFLIDMNLIISQSFGDVKEEDYARRERIHVKNGEIVININEHSHNADPALVEKGKIISKIKLRASETMEQTCVVINECLENVNEACHKVMPSHSALPKMVRRERKDLSAFPPNPTSLEELVIPVDIQNYELEKFLLADNQDSSCRIIIFGKESNTHLLKEVKKVFVDGTFKITPPLFCQVYVILGEMHGGMHPFIYALLPNKLRTTYDKLFSMLLEIQPRLQPEVIYCDYEIGNFKSLQNYFPSANIRGCFFHFAQNVYKKLTSLGLSQQYNTDASFALCAKMIIVLAFVPPDHITAAIMELADDLPQELLELLDWLEDNYVGRMNRRGNGRRSPLFPLHIWNVYERCMNDEDRTNNHAEAAHRRLQNELGMQHPTIWKFIDSLKTVQRGRDLHYEQLIAGQTPPIKLKKFREADARIKSVVPQFENRNILEYLRGIAHNFS